MQLAQQPQHLLAGLLIERPGRLVRQDDLGAVDQRPRDGDALLLSAGELARRMLQTLGHAEAGEQRGGARSEEHTSELQSLMRISYAGFCLKKTNKRHSSDN